MAAPHPCTALGLPCGPCYLKADQAPSTVLINKGPPAWVLPGGDLGDLSTPRRPPWDAHASGQGRGPRDGGRGGAAGDAGGQHCRDPLAAPSGPQGIAMAVGIASSTHMQEAWATLEHVGRTRFLRTVFTSPDSQVERAAWGRQGPGARVL